MKLREHQRAIYLRTKKQLGYATIAKKLNVSKSTISRWLEKYPISENRISSLRSIAQRKGVRAAQKQRQTMRVKREDEDRAVYTSIRKRFPKINSACRFVAGLMLYVAEGDKKSRYEVAFTNTDARLVRYFAQWLTEHLRVDERKIKYQVRIYENMDSKAELNYWMRSLRAKKEQFVKMQVNKLRTSSFTYKDTSRHGTCKLYIGGRTLKREIMLSIEAFFAIV